MDLNDLIGFKKALEKNAGIGRFIFETAGKALKRKFSSAFGKVLKRRTKLIGKGSRGEAGPALMARYERAKKRQLSQGRFSAPIKSGLSTMGIAGGMGGGALLYGGLTQPGRINTDKTRYSY